MNDIPCRRCSSPNPAAATACAACGADLGPPAVVATGPAGASPRRFRIRRLADVGLLAGGIVGVFLVLYGTSHPGRPTDPSWPTFGEELASAEEAFEILGQQAVVLQLVGGPARCWVDVTSDGRTKHYGLNAGTVRGDGAADQLERRRTMYREHRFVFVRQEPDKARVEHWMFAQSIGCCRDEPSPAGSPLGFRLRRWFHLVRPHNSGMTGFTSGDLEIPIGRAVEMLAVRSKATHYALPNPLPRGEDVVVATIDKAWLDGSGVVHQHAYAIKCRAGGP